MFGRFTTGISTGSASLEPAEACHSTGSELHRIDVTPGHPGPHRTETVRTSMVRRVLENAGEKQMRKLFLRASCAVSVLLAFSQFTVAQGLTTDFEAHPLIPKTNSTQPDGSAASELNHANDAGQAPGEAKFEGSVYPGAGTTINGLPLYVSARIKIGDRVQTADAAGKITLRTVSLDLSLTTTVLIQDPLILSCGVIFVRSGTVAINDGKNTLRFTTGQTVYASSTSCGDGLPDSPGSVRTPENRRSAFHSKSRSGSPVAAINGLFDGRVIDWSFVGVNSVMFASSVVAAEQTQNCLQAGACNDVPNAFQSRAAMYGAGLPTAVGVSYFSYYLKRHSYRWWYVPEALVTAGNLVYALHAAHYSH